jgi:ubiquinone/menaquinone biosynthesis C-methylase UbiE
MPQLLNRHDLIRTGPVDHADWTYRPLLGLIVRSRFRLISKFLPVKKVGRILEIGYGSGVFMPELARHCDHLYGIDVHSHSQTIQRLLRNRGVSVELATASAESMPYQDHFFDVVVAVSSLEFILDLAKAAAEIVRVLKPTGYLVIVTPGHSPLVDFGLKALTGESARNDFGTRRERLMPTLLEYFTVDRRSYFPPLAHHIACLYSAWRLVEPCAPVLGGQNVATSANYSSIGHT